MWKLFFAAVLVSIGALSPACAEETPIDFGRDVQPIFKTYCIDCHGPRQQKNGFRLDRRRDALRGGTATVIGPASSSSSRLYIRLIGNEKGPQMPPDGPLDASQIAIIKNWIDQGAKWPDELSGETPPTPIDPQAAQLMNDLRAGNRESFQKMLQENSRSANRKGPGGSTPLMYAVLYGDADAVRRLLDSGADPNIKNDEGATSLMWAVDDLEKSQLLLNQGADVNARSADGRSPLFIATSRFGAAPVVKLLLDRGANPSIVAHTYRGPATPLRNAADAGDESVVRLLLERGADPNAIGPLPLISAMNVQHQACIDLLIKNADKSDATMTWLFVAPPFGTPRAFSDASLTRLLLDRGANVNAKDDAGRSILMLAAGCDTMSLETINLLIQSGADLNTKSAAGHTALDFAKRRGDTAIVERFIQSGAKAGTAPAVPNHKPQPAPSARAALGRSIPLLQRADVTFLQKSGCVSCHHNSLTAMTVSAARRQGLAVDEKIARDQLTAIGSYIEGWRERALQNIGIPGGSNTVNYILAGMAAENYPPDPATDALARYLKNAQSPEGHWRLLANRPPLGSSEFEVTAVALRGLQVYAPRTQRSEYEKAVQRAVHWLTAAQPQTTADRAFQLLGLTWGGASRESLQNAARELISLQQPDGGWGQLPSMPRDAYATGQALVALRESGAVAVTDPTYERGVAYLLSTQLDDGSWHVQSRTIAFQPYFESGFPHGHDQWISAAATNWACMALVPAAR